MEKEIAGVKKLKNEIINIEEENTKTLKRITLFNKATSEFNSGKIEKAIYTLEKIKEENPDDYESTWFLARCYIGLGGNYYDKAINVAKEALSLVNEPQEAYHAYNQIASAYLGMENYSKALEVYREHLNSIKIAEIKNSHAYCYFRAKKNKEAYLKFQEAKKIKANISSCLGIAKTKLIYGKYEDSCTYAKRTIEDGSREEKMDLASIWTYYNLAFAYLILNKNECLDYINKANKKTTNKAQIRAQIIDYNLVLGNAGIDQELLEKCITLWKKSLANESI